MKVRALLPVVGVVLMTAVGCRADRAKPADSTENGDVKDGRNFQTLDTRIGELVFENDYPPCAQRSAPGRGACRRADRRPIPHS